MGSTKALLSFLRQVIRDHPRDISNLIWSKQTNNRDDSACSLSATLWECIPTNQVVGLLSRSALFFEIQLWLSHGLLLLLLYSVQTDRLGLKGLLDSSDPKHNQHNSEFELHQYQIPFLHNGSSYLKLSRTPFSVWIHNFQACRDGSAQEEPLLRSLVWCASLSLGNERFRPWRWG